MASLAFCSSLQQTTSPSDPLVILLQQTAIPISMLISKRLLKAKYVVWQYLGATIVMAGLVVVLVPSFAEKGAGAGAVQAAWVQPVWSLVMALSSVPMCLSSVYKEKKAGGSEDGCGVSQWMGRYIPVSHIDSPCDTCRVRFRVVH